jgi:hypothetical protein
MSVDEFRCVWYQVVDVDGKLYEGVDSDDSMTFSSAIKVKDIRKAVIDEYSHLRNIDPADFKIYQNRKAWEEKRQPLLKNSLISCGSEKDPVFVVVPPPVWFQLVGADRLPFNGSSVDALTLPRRSSIREFRDAIKTKYADSHLKGIAPDTLKIFAPGADSPLEVDVSIGELGKSKNDPLIVLVPSTSKLCLFLRFCST